MKKLSLLALSAALFAASLSAQTPAPVGPVPTKAQLAWQELETYAFVHFGLNTFNDLEWGYGDTPSSTFAPELLDVEQWVRTFKRAGMKGVILTAKHHDGFCLWPTKTTDYSVKNSPWKGGKGDLVGDLSRACKKYGLKFGLYLSPWDRNNAGYGKEAYQKIYHEQIRELSTQYGQLFEFWFDGANGGTGYYGGAREARQIDPKSYYGYHVAAEILYRNNPEMMIFGGTEPTIRWIGNERGWAGQTNWAMYDYDKEKHHTEAQWGMRDAKKWLPGEVDVSVRPGWFYHAREDQQVRSVANLVNLYYQSVGRNANLLLNFPIDLRGKVPAQDSINIVAWYDHLKAGFRRNLLSGASVQASSQRTGKAFAPQQLLDGQTKTYWAAAEGSGEVNLTFTLPRAAQINNLMLQEPIALGQRVARFRVETAGADGQFRPIDTQDSLTTIGYKRLLRFRPVEAKQLRVTVLESRGPVLLSEVAAYLVPEVLEAPSVRRDSRDSLYLTSLSRDAKLEYALLTGGKQGPWQTYTRPVYLPGDHVELVARVSTEVNKDKPELRYRSGYSSSQFVTPGLSPAQHVALFDGSGRTETRLGKGVRSLAIEFPEARPLTRFVYTPSQQRDAQGHIQGYELYVDGKRVAAGEFANIRNNPIPVAVDFPAGTKGQTLRLVVTKLVGDVEQVNIGDLAVE
nr:alpha-L-fucosidase [uncultured Porphyromonas sp.]